MNELKMSKNSRNECTCCKQNAAHNKREGMICYSRIEYLIYIVHIMLYITTEHCILSGVFDVDPLTKLC